MKGYIVKDENKTIEFLTLGEANAYCAKHPGSSSPAPVDLPDPVEVVSVPSAVAVWRVKAVLSIMGIKEQIDAAIEGLPEPNKTIAGMAWNAGTTIDRSSLLVASIAQIVQLTSAQVDQIFIQAEALPV